MHYKSPALHWICLISMLVAGVVAVLVGLEALGYRALEMDFLVKNPNLVMIGRYVILAAGILLLVSFVMKLMSGCHDCHCGKTPCMCDRKNPPYAS